jgi:hypothetical protein
MQNDAHNHTRDALAHALATTGTLFVKTEVKAYFKKIRDTRAACASTAIDPVQKSIFR